MPRIIVDSRESVSGLATALAVKGAEVVVEELECGDYVLAEGLVVERKSAADFVASIIDRRLFSQLATLKSAYSRVYLLVEGDIFNTRSVIAEDALLGAISYIAVIENVTLVHTANTAQTASILLMMLRHATEGLGYEVALRGAKPKDRKAQAAFLVEGLPSIGPATARKLLQHFGSALTVFTATPEELRAVPGLGPKTITALKETLEFQTQGTSTAVPAANS